MGKIILNKDKLHQKYVIEKLSKKKTAEYFNCSIDTVTRNLKEYNIQVHKNGSWAQHHKMHLTNYQKEILIGALLGDGCLTLGKHSVNPQFVYVSKSKQHVEFVCNNFMEYSYTEKIKHMSYFDKRTNKTYERYTFRTISDKELSELYKEWYFNGKKHIPKSLILTSTICLIWYIGDGCICNSNKDNSQYIKLSTHCFLKEEQEAILLPQLKQFNATLSKADKSKKTNEQQYFIRIPKNSMKDFLNYIGQCPFEDYLYKWVVKENKYKSYKDFYKEWDELYLSGVGYTEIARQYSADCTTVLAYLRKRGIYKNFIGYKQYYKEWEKRYLNGENYRIIAKDYGCSPQTVLHHLRQVKIYKE